MYFINKDAGALSDAAKVVNTTNIGPIKSSKGGPLQTHILDILKFENECVH